MPRQRPRTSAASRRSASRPLTRVSTEPHHEAVRHRARRVAGGVPRLPWRTLRNPFRPLEVLSAPTRSRRSIARRSGSSREIGVEVPRRPGPRSLRAGRRARSTGERRRVRLDGAQVEELVALAPAEFTLHARNPARNVTLRRPTTSSSRRSAARRSSTDLDRGRRAGTWRGLPGLRPLSSAASTSSTRRPAARSSRPTCRSRPATSTCTPASRRLLDKTWHCLGFGADGRRGRARGHRASPAGVDRDTLAREPSLITIINTNSPLRLDGPMGDGLIAMAEAGQAVVATPFTLAGAMTPGHRSPAAIAQQNAEALFCVALTQIVRPGAPVVYGAFTSNVDMRTGSPAFGTPEYVKGAIASGQMARRYRLPWRSSNATASAVVDAQAAYESEMAVWGAVMGGVNLLYQGAGWLEGGLTASYEKLIVDAEILQMMSEVLQPVVVDEASLGLDAIAEVGPGGHFFGVGPHARAVRDRVLPADRCPTGGTTRRGRTTAPGPRRSGRTGSGSSSSPSSSRRRSTRRRRGDRRTSSPAASARSPQRPADRRRDLIRIRLAGSPEPLVGQARLQPDAMGDEDRSEQSRAHVIEVAVVPVQVDPIEHRIAHVVRADQRRGRDERDVRVICCGCGPMSAAAGSSSAVHHSVDPVHQVSDGTRRRVRYLRVREDHTP